MQILSFFFIFAFFILNIFGEDRSFFAPYGPENGDATLFRNDDSYTDAVLLIGNMNFFNSTRTYLYVDNNGIITLDGQLSTYTPSSLSTVDIAAIAPYWADVDTRPDDGGFVYYRSTLDQDLADSVSTFVRATNPGNSFIGTRTFVASWIAVGYYSEHTNKKCWFQCILIADDFDQTFAIFNYGDMEWTTGDASGGFNGTGGVPAAVGFTKGSDGVYAQVDTSLTADIINIGEGTNCAIDGVPQIGQYIYSVSNGASVNTCCYTSQPPYLNGTPTDLNFQITNINMVPDFNGTVTATYECTIPATQIIDPVVFTVYGCPVTRTWTAIDACFKRSSVQQVFIYPQVFNSALSLTVPPDYTVFGDCTNPDTPDPSVSGNATSNRGVITYQDSVWVQYLGFNCTLTRFWQAQDICNVFQRGEQHITYVVNASAILTTQQMTTHRLTTRDITTTELTTEEEENLNGKNNLIILSSLVIFSIILSS